MSEPREHYTGANNSVAVPPRTLKTRVRLLHILSKSQLTTCGGDVHEKRIGGGNSPKPDSADTLCSLQQPAVAQRRLSYKVRAKLANPFVCAFVCCAVDSWLQCTLCLVALF